MTNQIIKRNKK